MARLDVTSSRESHEDEQSSQSSVEKLSYQSSQYQDQEEEEEEKKAAGDHISDFQIGEHIDCKDTVNKWLNAEVIAARNEDIKVHYSGWSAKYDEWINVRSDRLLKQWKPGMRFQLNHRLDIYDRYEKWLEARVANLTHNSIQVHFKGYKDIYDETLPQNSEKIQPVGRFSSAYGAAKFNKRSPLTTSDSRRSSSQESNLDDTEEKRKKRLEEERKFLAKLKEQDLTIGIMHGDGNCLFRAIADQVYGNQELHDTIRQRCMDYLDIERNFFGSYIVGGVAKFDEYLNLKRKDGCWGDDVEIQAMSEIYNCPIEIYAYSTTPMRTFHESSEKGINSIKISYHGSSHYNSISPLSGIVPLIDKPCGEVEENAIRKAVEAKEAQEARARSDRDAEVTTQDAIREMVRVSREAFESQGVRDMEIALQESLKEFNKSEKPPGELEIEEEMAVKESLREYEKHVMVDSERQLMEAIMKESKQDSVTKDILEIERKELEEALKFSCTETNNMELTPSMKSALEMGYTLEMVIQARDIVGDDAQMIINFINENLFD